MIPLPLNQHHQDAWDLLVVKASADIFLEDICSRCYDSCSSSCCCYYTRESGVCLRLDTSLCNPHICRASVDAFATHGLSCKWSEGRHFRHSSINDIIRRALDTANVPSKLHDWSLLVCLDLMEPLCSLGGVKSFAFL